MLSVREAVRALPKYETPLGDRSGSLLDMNESSAGCSPRVLQRLQSLTADSVRLYPDRRRAEQLIAEHLQLSPDQVLLTNGADEAIHLLCEAYLEPGDEMLFPVPTFSMFEIYARQTGANVIQIESGPNFEIPVDAILNRLQESQCCKIVAIASPNNPTGTVISRADLVRIVQAAPHSAVLLDEAYVEFYGSSMADLLNEFENLFVARTFSKAYGLAGLRIGAIAGSAGQMELLRRLSSPFNVNAAALACMEAALEDSEFLERTVEGVRMSRGMLAEGLKSLGFEVFPSEANFLYVRLGADATQIVQSLAEQRIYIRDRGCDPGGAGCVRITVGTREQVLEFLLAIAEVSSKLSVGRSA